ncbi:MAG: bifunctional riboflavin kinase/FAD synthetase [bacterium]
MRVLSEIPLFHTKTAITVGNFDGVHLGHQKLIEHLVSRAKEKKLTSVMITFEPHPMEYFFQEKKFLRITCLAEMEQLLKCRGVDFLVQLKFTDEMSTLSPELFFESILVNQFNAAYIIVGEDHLFGKGRKGTPHTLKKLAARKGIDVDIEKQYEIDGTPVSSTRIRQMILNGDLDQARKLLGHGLLFTGPVVRGSGRGSSLGMATANLQLPNRVLPPSGVYASKTNLLDKWFPSLSYFGKAPTFKGETYFLETHIMEPMGPLYGQVITVDIVKWLRNEIVFDSKEDLIEQMKQDLIHAKHVLPFIFEDVERKVL